MSTNQPVDPSIDLAAGDDQGGDFRQPIESGLPMSLLFDRLEWGPSELRAVASALGYEAGIVVACITPGLGGRRLDERLFMAGRLAREAGHYGLMALEVEGQLAGTR